MNMASEELYSLLVPLAGDRLIVPRACVAEVVRFSRPDTRDGSADWLLGTVTWNGRELPVVSFEGVIGKPMPEATGRARIVVFHAGSVQLSGGAFGILTQGFPQLVRVNREVLRLDTKNDGWPDEAPVLCRVKMINEYPLIPHLDKLAERVHEEMAQA